jgi:hypothetical protein
MLGVTQVNPFPEFQPLKKPITRAFATKAESVVMTRNKSQQPDLLTFYGGFPLVSFEQICYLQHAEVLLKHFNMDCEFGVRVIAFACLVGGTARYKRKASHDATKSRLVGRWLSFHQQVQTGYA